MIPDLFRVQATCQGDLLGRRHNMSNYSRLTRELFSGRLKLIKVLSTSLPSLPVAVGLAVAITFLESLNRKALWAREQELTPYCGGRTGYRLMLPRTGRGTSKDLRMSQRHLHATPSPLDALVPKSRSPLKRQMSRPPVRRSPVPSRRCLSSRRLRSPAASALADV